MKNLLAVLSLIVLSFSSDASAKEENKLNGTWHNQWGSEMRLTVDSEGRVSGKYHTAVGREDITKPETWFDITGFVNGDVISFVVSWGPKSGAISAWSGHYIPKEKSPHSVPQIRTLTHTSVNVSDADQWKRTAAGADTFEPGAASK